jgi:hypothetical protein
MQRQQPKCFKTSVSHWCGRIWIARLLFECTCMEEHGSGVKGPSANLGFAANPEVAPLALPMAQLPCAPPTVTLVSTI